MQGSTLPVIHGGQDLCLWGQKGIKFSAAAAWEHIRPKAPRVEWAKLLWHRNHIPRHSFIVLVVQQKLHTQDRMIGMGRSELGHCMFCKQQMKTHDHLFFLCKFLRPLLQEWASKCGITMPGSSVASHFQHLATKLRKSAEGVLIKTSFCSLIYAVWKARNDAIFRDIKPTLHVLKQHIRKVLTDIAASKNYKMSQREMNILHHWRIHIPIDSLWWDC